MLLESLFLDIEGYLFMAADERGKQSMSLFTGRTQKAVNCDRMGFRGCVNSAGVMVVAMQLAFCAAEEAFAWPVFLRTTIGEYFKICLYSPGSFKYDRRVSSCEEKRELAG
jgi:hypothetical protein